MVFAATEFVAGFAAGAAEIVGVGEVAGLAGLTAGGVTAAGTALVFPAGASALNVAQTGNKKTTPNPAIIRLGVIFMVPEKNQGRSAPAERPLEIE